MVRLRGYGDAIDVETFTQLISAYMEVAPPERSQILLHSPSQEGTAAQ
jgi:hypothetical protein